MIELLAVIVVLAIIALIATPIVMKTIKNAKKGAAERSADSYIKQVETAVATSKLDGEDVPDGTYEIDGDGNLTVPSLKDGKLKIEVSGNKPESGTVTIANGQVTSTSEMDMGDYVVSYDKENNKYETTEKSSTPAVEVLCKANTTKATALVWGGSADPAQESSYTSEEVGLLASEATSKYDAGVIYTCELGDGEQNTFFILETNGDDVSLIAGMNLGSTVEWSEDGNNHRNEDESAQATALKTALKERTSGWIKLSQSQITLPTASQIAAASGKTFDDSSGGISGLATWQVSFTKLPVAYGYWTSTPLASYDGQAWYVEYGNKLGSWYVENANRYGVRPVITISKSQLG